MCPSGSPISASTNRGLSTIPLGDAIRSWRETVSWWWAATSVSDTPGFALLPSRLRLPAERASPAVGVGQVTRATRSGKLSSPEGRRSRSLTPSWSRPNGVGQVRAIVHSGGFPFVAYSALPSCGHPLFCDP